MMFDLSPLCRQAVEDNYNDLQAQIEAQQAQHAEIITLLSARMEEAKKQNNDMSDRVSYWLFAHAHDVHVSARKEYCLII